MGMMVVYKGSQSVLEIVDGQQRITTFFILLCAISHIYQENNDTSGKAFEEKIHHSKIDEDGSAKDSYVLELQYARSTDCLDMIFHNSIPSNNEIEYLLESDKRLIEAYLTIKNTLSNSFSSFLELRKFASFILRKIEFVQIETEDISDALKIFETINERGVGLTPMDLLKNKLFMQVNKDLFKQLNEKWEKMIKDLTIANEKPLRFLRYFISATYDVINPNTNTITGILPEEKIYEWLIQNDGQCHYTTQPFEFIELMNTNLKRYISFLNPNSNSSNDHLRNIPLIAGLSYRLHLVPLMAASKMPPTVLEHFEQALESVVYYAMIDGVKANETEKIFAAWCPEIRKISDLDGLKHFVKTAIIPQIDKWKSSNNHHQRFLSLGLHSMQQYRIKYILSRLTKYVDDVRGGGTRYADITSCYDKKNQIEHIMPQVCTDPTEYGVPAEEFDLYKSLLGNLTLLERTYNAACQNKPYEEKIIIYANSAFYLTKALPTLENAGVNTAANRMNEKLQSWKTWNQQAILERQEMLYKLSEIVWKINDMPTTWK